MDGPIAQTIDCHQTAHGHVLWKLEQFSSLPTHLGTALGGYISSNFAFCFLSCSFYLLVFLLHLLFVYLLLLLIFVLCHFCFVIHISIPQSLGHRHLFWTHGRWIRLYWLLFGFSSPCYFLHAGDILELWERHSNWPNSNFMECANGIGGLVLRCLFLFSSLCCFYLLFSFPFLLLFLY